MDSTEKQRILVAYERATLLVALANRGFYVFGEPWRGNVCGRVTPSISPSVGTLKRDSRPGPDGLAAPDTAVTMRS